MDTYFTGEMAGVRVGYDDSRRLQMLRGWGDRFEGWIIEPGEAAVAVGDAVFIHTIDDLSPSFRPDLDRAHAAVAIARRSDIQACPTIARLIDYLDAEAEVFADHTPWSRLHSAWEWGDVSLRETIDAGGTTDWNALAADIEASITVALTCVHAAGLVHSDVAPNNIVRIGDAWKLIDFDHCVKVGDAITGSAPAPYGPPDIRPSYLAHFAMDTDALDAIVAELRAKASR